ncbi:MAG: AAA family ATPase [Acidilobaceae archaeon]
MLVIAVTGMPGSGKSFVAQVLARELKYPIIVMGDIVREETIRRGLELTSINIEMVARELRILRGPSVIADIVVEKAEKLESNGLIVDGVRSLDEIKSLSRLGRICIVAVHSPQILRYRRIIERARKGDTMSIEEFKLRDYSNLELGVGNVIALANYMIVNTSTLEHLEEEAIRVAGEIRDGKYCS